MIARFPVHVAYMEQIMPPEGAALRKQMNALKAVDEGRATDADRRYIEGKTPPMQDLIYKNSNMNSARVLNLLKGAEHLIYSSWTTSIATFHRHLF